MDGGSLLPKFEAAGITVRSAGMRRGVPGPRGLATLRNIIREERPDILQGWMYHANVALSVAARLARSRVPLVWNIRRCLLEQNRDKMLTRWMVAASVPLSRRTDRIVYCVDVAANQHEDRGFDRSKRVVIPNGFDLDRVKPGDGFRGTLRRELRLNPTTQLVGIAGRYHPVKDYQSFLRAAAIVAKELPDAHFVLAGRDVTMDNDALSSLVKELHLGSRVHLLGERQDLPDVLSALDVFCSSSANEGFPNVVGEALACGLPAVVTDAGASREMVEGIGIVVPRLDPRAIADGLLTMLRMPEHERRAIGERSRGRMVERYSLQTMVARYAELYRELGPDALVQAI
jgi:glycosyltransferase involved in cell wall biosynthesis